MKSARENRPGRIRFSVASVSLCALLVCTTSSQTSRRPPLPVGRVTAGRDMITARGGHTATVLPDFKILIAGGKQEHGIILASTEVYDPTTEKFSAGAKMLTAREGHIAAPLSDSKILIAGGQTRDGIALSSSEDYDDETGRFTARGNMHARRIRPTATVLRDGRILVTGGSDGAQPLASAETYDVLTGKWTLTGNMASARSGHTATLLSDGRVLIVGGTSRGHSVLASAEIFDPKSNQFRVAGKLGQARTLHTAALLTSGKVLIAGGASQFDGSNPLSSSELYDPASRSFTASGSMADPHLKLPDGASLLDGRVLIMGGAAAVEIFDSKTGTFRVVSGALDTPRYDSAAFQVMDGSVRFFGGYDSAGISTAKTWIYRP